MTASREAADPAQADAAQADLGHADVVVCPGGPLLLRGDHVVLDEDGTAHPTVRPVSAVCRCGHSATRPWCDGTHKLLPH